MFAMKHDQLELFPIASESEVERTKKLLEDYQQLLHTTKTLAEDLDDLSETERASYEKDIRKLKRVERAVKCILDPSIREIIQYRYIDGNNFTSTVIEYANMMDDRTVGRKLNKGIRSVAEILKTF